MSRSSLRDALVLALVAGCIVVAVSYRTRMLEERLARHNVEAARDTSRVVYQDGLRRVSERLAFQQRSAIELEGDYRRLLRARNEQTRALVRLKVEMDSLAGAVTRGEVTALPDTALRRLSARLDSAGFHVSVRADVPPPPSEARVTWTVRRDPIGIVAALNETPDGRLALRAAAEGGNATAQIDTVRVQIEGRLRATRTAATVGLLMGIGYGLGRLLEGLFGR